MHFQQTVRNIIWPSKGEGTENVTRIVETTGAAPPQAKPGNKKTLAEEPWSRQRPLLTVSTDQEDKE